MNQLSLPGLMCILYSITIMAFGTVSSCAAADAVTREQVLSEYPNALKALDERFTHVSGTVVLSTPEFHDKPIRLINRMKFDFAFSGVNGLYTSTVLDDINVEFGPDKREVKKKLAKSFQDVFGVNDKYSFWLSKQKPTSDYVIKMLETRQKQSQGLASSKVGAILRCSTILESRPISSILSSPGLRIVRVTENPSGASQNTIRIEFALEKKVNTDPKYAKMTIYYTTSGWLIVSPRNGWVLHEYGLNTVSTKSTETTRVGHVEYKKGSSGMLEPVKSWWRGYKGHYDTDPSAADPAVLPTSGESYEFSKLTFGDRPASDFTLTAFGLPEFGQDSPPIPAAASKPASLPASAATTLRPQSTSLWMFSGAAAAGLVAFGLRSISR